MNIEIEECKELMKIIEQKIRKYDNNNNAPLKFRINNIINVNTNDSVNVNITNNNNDNTLLPTMKLQQTFKLKDLINGVVVGDYILKYHSRYGGEVDVFEKRTNLQNNHNEEYKKLLQQLSILNNKIDKIEATIIMNNLQQ